MPTIREVAKHAGVSPITVSRVINKSGYVSQDVRDRVEKAISELHYIPNALGTSLRSNRTHIIALILSDVTNPFWTTLARGVEDAANESGYYVVLCNTDESQAKQNQYVNVLLKKRVDGFLLVPAESNNETIQTIVRQQVPVVVLDRRVSSKEVDVVRADSEGGAYRLTRHLIQQGHRRIAIITGPQGVSTASDRVDGYRRAMEEAGLKINEAQIYWGKFAQSHGYNAAQLILDSTPRPTALVTGNNFIAVGAMHALRGAGIQVPQGMAVVTFDDFPAGLTFDPFLTTAVQPAYEMGYRATQLLLARLLEQTTDPCQETVLPVEITIRDSSNYTLPKN
ncbi:MAG: LacI family DNA-binding transcriptional regulator [Aggregatilineales bacterium]